MEEDFLMISAFLLFTALPTAQACNPIIPGALLNRSNRTLLSLNLAPPPQYTYSDMPTYGQMPSARAAESNADKDLQLAILSTLAEHGIMAEKVLLKYQYSAPKLYLANGNNCTQPDTYVVHDGAILYKCVAAPIRAKRSRRKSEDEAMMTFRNTTEAVNATTPITEGPTARITAESAANTTTTSTTTTTTATEYATKSIVSTVAMTQTLTNVIASSEYTSTSAVTTASMEGINSAVYNTTITPEDLTTAAATEITVQPNKTSVTTKGGSVEGTVATTELLTTVLPDLKSKSNPLKAQITAGTLGNATLAEVLTKPLKAPPTVGVTMALSETITAFGHSAEPSEATTTKATIAPPKNRTAVVFSSEPFEVTMATEATVASSEDITVATEAPIITSQVTSATKGATGSLESRVATTELLTTVLLHSKLQPNLLKARRTPDFLGNTTAPELSIEPSEATTTTGVTVVSSETIMAVELSTEPSEATTTRATTAPSRNLTVVKFSYEPSKATTTTGATVASSGNITAVEFSRELSRTTSATTATIVSSTTTSGAAVVFSETIKAVERSTKLSGATTTKATNPPSGNKTAFTFSSEASKATATTGATIASRENRTTTEASIIKFQVTAANEGTAGTVESRVATTKPLTTFMPHSKSKPNLLRAQPTGHSMGNTTAAGVSTKPLKATPTTTATMVSSQTTTTKAAIAPFGNTATIEFSRDPSGATTTTGATIDSPENRAATKVAIMSSHVTVAAEGATRTVENTTTTGKIFTSAVLQSKLQPSLFKSQIAVKPIGSAATEASTRLSEATAPVAAPRGASEAVTITETPFKSSDATTTNGITFRNSTTINDTAVDSGKNTTPTDLTTKGIQITATSHKTRSYGRAAASSNDVIVQSPEATIAAAKQPVDMVRFQIVTAVTVETPQPIPESQWKMYAEKIQEKLEQRHVIFTGDILVKVL